MQAAAAPSSSAAPALPSVTQLAMHLSECIDATINSNELESSHALLLHALSSVAARPMSQPPAVGVSHSMRSAVANLPQAGDRSIVIVRYDADSGPKIVNSIHAFGKEWLPMSSDEAKTAPAASSSSASSSSASSGRIRSSGVAGLGEASVSSSSSSSKERERSRSRDRERPADGTAGSESDVPRALVKSLPTLKVNEVLFVSSRSALFAQPTAALLSYEQREKQLPAALAASEAAYRQAIDSTDADMEVGAIGVLALEKEKLKKELAKHQQQPKPQPNIVDVRDCMVLPLGDVKVDGNEYHITMRRGDAALRDEHQPQLCIVDVAPRHDDIASVDALAGSQILQEKHYRDLQELFDGKMPKLRLLYSGKRDGYFADAFHRHCDGSGEPTLTIVRAITKGETYVFGGYNAESWESYEDDVWSREPGWVFSLESPTGLLTKYAFTGKGDGSTLNSAMRGPCWGRGLVLAVDFATKCKHNHSERDDNFSVVPGFSGTTFTNTTLAGSPIFAVDEIEVFACSEDDVS